MFIAQWVRKEVRAGNTALSDLVTAAPYEGAAVRTIAEDGDFYLRGENVYENPEPSFSWFPQAYPELEQRGEDIWVLRVTVTDELVDGTSLPIPRALAAIFQVPRTSRVVLDSEHSAQLLHLFDHGAVLGPIDRFLKEVEAHPGDEVELIFDAGRDHFSVTRSG